MIFILNRKEKKMKTNFVKKFIFLFALISLLVVNGCKKLDIEKNLELILAHNFKTTLLL